MDVKPRVEYFIVKSISSSCKLAAASPMPRRLEIAEWEDAYRIQETRRRLRSISCATNHLHWRKMVKWTASGHKNGWAGCWKKDYHQGHGPNKANELDAIKGNLCICIHFLMESANLIWCKMHHTMKWIEGSIARISPLLWIIAEQVVSFWEITISRRNDPKAT